MMTRDNIRGKYLDRMVASILYPGSIAKTFVACENVYILCVLGEDAITHRLLKKFAQQDRSE